MISLSLQAVRRLAALDADLFLRINCLHRYFRLERIVRMVSFTGDGYLYVALAVILPLLYPEEGLHFLLSGLLCFAIAVHVLDHPLAVELQLLRSRLLQRVVARR